MRFLPVIALFEYGFVRNFLVMNVLFFNYLTLATTGKRDFNVGLSVQKKKIISFERLEQFPVDLGRSPISFEFELDLDWHFGS